MLSIFRGDDKQYTLTFTNQAGQAVNITGATVWLTIKEEKTDPTPLIQIEQDNHTNPTGGITTIEIPRTETAGVTPGRYYYDIQILTAQDKVNTVSTGIAVFYQDVNLIPGESS